AGARTPAWSRPRLLQLLEQLALLLRELLGHVDLHAGDQVAAARALQAWGALAAHAQELAVLGSTGDLHRDLAAVRGRHLGRRPERGVGERHVDVDHQVVAPPRESLRGLDARDHVEVPCRSAVPARLALALQADPSAVLRARGDLDRVALRPPLAACTAAGWARVLDDRPVPAAAGARLREREEALALGNDATAAADRADRGRGARLGARAAAGVARNLERDRDLRLHALQRVPEREVDLDLDVVPSLRWRGPCAGHTAAEEAAEQVAEVAEVDSLARRPPEATSGAGPAAVRRAEAVVRLPLLRVG